MKNLKKVTSFLLTLALLASMTSAVFANELPKPDGFSANGTSFGDAVGTVLGFIQYIGYAVAVGMLLYIGIKYMMASAADKADLKKGAINYVIGAVLIGGASAVAGFLVDILKTKNG